MAEEMADNLGRLGKAVRTEQSFESLIELRNVLADAMDSSDDARSIAALSRQLTEVLARIDELRPPVDDGKPLTVVEQLMERRKSAS
ncbi:hypothetical protein [Corynebacterium jeikeium]|uniref:hypothetical protein n=1 Tax=Corynebacterium jeikeium TaxID=38289 RepID=UPI000552997F|nr:hypothetical protein [Corynebacterium jeikeium]